MSVFPMRPSVTVVTGRKGDKKLVDCSVDASPSIPSAVKAASKLSGKKKHVLHIHPHTTNYRQLTDNRFSLFKKKTGLKYKKKKVETKREKCEDLNKGHCWRLFQTVGQDTTRTAEKTSRSSLSSFTNRKGAS